MIKYILFTTSLLVSFNADSDKNELFSNIDAGQEETTIKSIKIYKTGDELSNPIIELGSKETITLTFDDLSDNSSNYSYSIVHCNSEWDESGLISSDYMDGFEPNSLTNSQNSVGTTIPYMHYSLELPNNDVKIKISGNYLVKVFDTYNSTPVVVERRFRVVESLVSINARIIQPIDPSYKSTSQQLELSIKYSPLKISNPYTDLTVEIFQNSQPINSVHRLQPTFIKNDEITYSTSNQPIFDGVNEFRSFDLNTFRYISLGVSSIEQIGSEYSVQLQPSENNRAQKYFNKTDKNGSYIIKLANSELSNIEADYSWIYFTLPYYDQLPEKEVYVVGELTDWQCSPQNMMQYSYQRQAYELRMYLKQGYYNYRYVVKDIKTGTLDQTFFEGNHSETENDYLFLVYYKQQGDRYERLVGMKKLNTRN